jgi:ribosome-binding protein aMBF1 (putative translation factor)
LSNGHQIDGLKYEVALAQVVMVVCISCKLIETLVPKEDVKNIKFQKIITRRIDSPRKRFKNYKSYWNNNCYQ